MTGLMPCPFCGCEEVEPIFDERNAFVVCLKCDAAGPTVVWRTKKASLVEAECLWNKRHSND